MRCPDCNKFVSYAGDEEPEEQDLNISDDGTVTASVRLHKDCSECSTELKELEVELSAEVPQEWMDEHPLGEGEEYEVQAEYAASEDMEKPKQKTKKDGTLSRPTPYRYLKTYYGVEATFTVTAPDGETLELEASAMEPASAFNELN